MVGLETKKRILHLDKLFKQLYFKPSNYKGDVGIKVIDFANELNRTPEVDFNYAHYLVELLCVKLGYALNIVLLLRDLDFGGNVSSKEWHKIIRSDRRKMLQRRIDARHNNVHRDRM